MSLTQIGILFLVVIATSLATRSNRKDGTDYLIIKIINAVLMTYIIVLVGPNLLFIKEIIEGNHQVLFTIDSIMVYYLYLIALILSSLVYAFLASLLLIRVYKARKPFMILTPLMIFLTEIKTFNIVLHRQDSVSPQNAYQSVVFSIIIMLIISAFVLSNRYKIYLQAKPK